MCDFALPDDFNHQQKTALLASSEFTFDIHGAVEKIRKGEYELWADVTNYKQLGLTTTENLELPDWAFTYFDFEKFGYDIAAEHNGTIKKFAGYRYTFLREVT